MISCPLCKTGISIENRNSCECGSFYKFGTHFAFSIDDREWFKYKPFNNICIHWNYGTPYLLDSEVVPMKIQEYISKHLVQKVLNV